MESASGQDLDEVAEQARAALQEALDARIEQQKLPGLLMDIGLTLATALALGLVLWGIVRFHLRAIRSERLLPTVAIKVGGADLQPFLRTMERAAVKLTSFGLGVIAVYV